MYEAMIKSFSNILEKSKLKITMENVMIELINDYF